jgi:hypothetical protein
VVLSLRLAMCRPHTWTIAFAIAVVGLLISGRHPKSLFLASALHGLVHTAGWLAVALAGLWTLTSLLPLRDAPRPRRIDWRPVAIAAAGWLVGQLLHPNFPENFRVFWLQNAVVPFSGAAGEGGALRAAFSRELLPPDLDTVLREWPVLLGIPAALALIGMRPELRTRATVLAAVPALGFLLLGLVLLRRSFEMAAPFGVLLLALLAREWVSAHPGARLSRRTKAALGLLLLGGCIRSAVLGREAIPPASPPMAMGRWAGEQLPEGAGVFTAQWSDGAALFYYAPQATSLVVLDPTFFFAKDPERFAEYVDIALGRRPRPVRAIREVFASDYIAIRKIPVFARFEQVARASRRTQVVYEDPFYVVLRILESRRETRRPPHPEGS